MPHANDSPTITTRAPANCSFTGMSAPVTDRNHPTTSSENCPSGGTRSQMNFDRTVPTNERHERGEAV